MKEFWTIWVVLTNGSQFEPAVLYRGSPQFVMSTDCLDVIAKMKPEDGLRLECRSGPPRQSTDDSMISFSFKF